MTGSYGRVMNMPSRYTLVRGKFHSIVPATSDVVLFIYQDERPRQLAVTHMLYALSTVLGTVQHSTYV